ncbi:hypothetical protein WJ968_28445 [Achromobacter xylosoxidans]
MNIAAISPVPRVAAPYPARIPLLDDTRPVWETEFTARQAQRAAQLRAGRNTQPVSHARLADVPASDARGPRPSRHARPPSPPRPHNPQSMSTCCATSTRISACAGPSTTSSPPPSSRPPMARRTWAPSPA